MSAFETSIFNILHAGMRCISNQMEFYIHLNMFFSVLKVHNTLNNGIHSM